MNIDLLMSFCSKDETRTIAKPFSDELYTYATNGYVMIRVDRVDDVPINSPVTLEHMEELFDCTPTTPMPEITITKKQCPACEGSGRVTKCPECDGCGWVDFDNRFNTYEVECKSCDGDGVTPGNKNSCDVCKGTGKIVDKEKNVEIDGIAFRSTILDPITKLTNVKFFVRKEDKPATFSFDGGMGVVMPVRL
jgi:hypothetical protein